MRKAQKIAGLKKRLANLEAAGNPKQLHRMIYDPENHDEYAKAGGAIIKARMEADELRAQLRKLEA